MAAWAALKSSIVLSLLCPVALGALWQSPSQLPQKTYDYIIVGGAYTFSLYSLLSESRLNGL